MSHISYCLFDFDKGDTKKVFNEPGNHFKNTKVTLGHNRKTHRLTTIQIFINLK